MVFDEKAHFSTINYYSLQDYPLFANQDKSIDIEGIVAKNPNIGYYGFFGLILKVIRPLVGSINRQVILLRIIHGILFIIGILFIVKSLKIIGLSGSEINISILSFTLLPVTTFMAAHINYDNALFCLASIYINRCLLAIVVENIETRDLLFLVSLGIYTCLVKIIFIPVVIISFLYLLFFSNIHLKISSKTQPLKFYKDYKFILVVVFFVVTTFLSVARLLSNQLSYGNINPSCATVLGEQRCEKNYFYIREKTLIREKPGVHMMNFVQYSFYWIKTMINSLYFFAGRLGDGIALHPGYPHFLIKASTLIGVAAACIFALQYHKSKNKKLSIFIIVISLFYVAILFINNFISYKHLGSPQAIQGRYILFILPYMLGLLLWIMADFIINKKLKLLLLTLLIIVFTQGGGFVGYITKSDERWYWSNKYIIQLNNGARKVLSRAYVF